MYASNLKVAARHGSTPFSLTFARTANGFKDFQASQDIRSPFDEEGYIQRLEYFAETIFPAVNEKTKAYIAQRFKDDKTVIFPDGAFVMTTNKNKKNKLEAQYEGPYMIIRRNKGGAYILQDTDGTVMPRNYTPSELKIISQDPNEQGKSFVIEKILKHRGDPQNYEYKVKWKNFSKEHNTWEPAANFDDRTIIDAYWTRQAEAQKKKGGYVVETTLKSKALPLNNPKGTNYNSTNPNPDYKAPGPI